MIARVITGGQTGVDQAALRAAEACGIATGGYAPKGWTTEDGPARRLLAGFGLTEHPAPDYPARTAANVGAATACLWFGAADSPGGRLTRRLCAAAEVPVLLLTPAFPIDPAAEWVARRGRAVTLMAAGNRESRAPGIGAAAEAYFRRLFARCLELAAKAGA